MTAEKQFSPLLYWDRRPAAEAFECRICSCWHGAHLRDCTVPQIEGLLTLDYKLPCEVRLPTSMSIGKGVPLSTLMTAFRQRESWPDEDTRFNDERAKAIQRALDEAKNNG